jgi:outer membrane protein assembly factor BamE
MKLIYNFNIASFLVFALVSQDAESSIANFFDRISSSIESTLTDYEIKPFVISIEQGSLLDENKLERIDTGLSKEQVIYLLGKPSTTNPFLSDQWNYVYFNNTTQKEIKKLSIFFKNEKVYKVLIQDNVYKTLGNDAIKPSSLNNAPINKPDSEIDKDLSPIVLSLETNRGL